MPDTKITALAAITTVDPAADVLPIVDISDTSMAASGTTKKITSNQILGAGGTATLASATITGDLTVRTNKLAVTSAGVGFGTTTPAYPAHFRTTSPVIAIQDDTSAATGVGGTMNFLGFTSGTSGANIFAQIKGVKTAGSAGGEYQVFTSDSAGNSVQRYLIDSTGVSTWSVGGSTAMTLNATGLGVGVASPSYKLDVAGAGNFQQLRVSNTAATNIGLVNTTSGLTYSIYSANTASNGFDGFGIFNGTSYDLRIVSGNFGIGVEPSGKLEVQESGTGGGIGGIIASTATAGGNAGYVFRTGGTNRWSLSLTGSAGAESIRFYDVNNSATRLLIDTSGNVISNVTGTAPTLATNSQMVFNLTSNTNLRISVRGTDGVTRTANITLA